MEGKEIHSSSFRDPSGFIYRKGGLIFRQINQSYFDDYELFLSSGLKDLLVNKGHILDFDEVKREDDKIVIKPEQIKLITYPYEWSFTQLKDAAILTLLIQKISIQRGMTLKDASAFNIQFIGGKPVMIDTLSFEKYDKKSPWVAYKQFCQHFLIPLLLYSKVDYRVANALQINHIDGIPLDLGSKLLPRSSFFSLKTLFHIHLNAKSEQKFKKTSLSKTKVQEQKEKIIQKKKFSKNAMLGLIDNLLSSVRSIKWKVPETQWGDYYNDTNYEKRSADEKANILANISKKLKRGVVWDFGCNTGVYSMIFAKEENGGHETYGFDVDPVAIEKSYLNLKSKKIKNFMPFRLDLSAPSPGIGWANDERDSISNRACADHLIALALIHHLAISNNLPFVRIAEFFSRLCKNLIIEFVPKNDTQVQRLLENREDIFCAYDEENFVKDFSNYFKVKEKIKIPNTVRTLYILAKK